MLYVREDSDSLSNDPPPLAEEWYTPLKYVQ